MIAAVAQTAEHPLAQRVVKPLNTTEQARHDAYISRVLAEAPPLSAEQRAKLAELLRPVRRGVAK